MVSKSSTMAIVSIGLNVLWIGYCVTYMQSNHHRPEESIFDTVVAQGPRALHESMQRSRYGGVERGDEAEESPEPRKREQQQRQQELNSNHDDFDDDGSDDSSFVRPNSVEPLARSDDNVFRMPLTYVENKDKSLYSNGHCIGDNFRDFQYQYTSCHVNLLCYDMADEDWVILDSPYEAAMRRAIRDEVKALDDETISTGLYSMSSNLDLPWSIGVINPQWPPDDWVRLKRQFRRVARQGFYMLPENVVMLPFHSMAGFNPGHLIWDDFMAFWMLADSFDLWKKDKHFLYMREAITDPPIWATCEDDKYEDLPDQCRATFPKFFPLMGSYSVVFDKPQLSELFPDQDQQSQLICAKEGITGLGTLSDHGMKQHGWWSMDYEWNHNVGRAPQLYKFRSFLMQNVGVSPELPRRRDRPLILFSQWSSRRSFDFEPFAEFVQEKFRNTVEVRLVEFREMDLDEQIALVAEASMLVSVAGGGTFTAMSLPRGASLVLYYESDVTELGQGDLPPEEQEKNPARLDYDIWNNVGYLRTHWLPFHNISQPVHGPGPIFQALVRQELDVMEKQGY